MSNSDTDTFSTAAKTKTFAATATIILSAIKQRQLRHNYIICTHIVLPLT